MSRLPRAWALAVASLVLLFPDTPVQQFAKTRHEVHHLPRFRNPEQHSLPRAPPSPKSAHSWPLLAEHNRRAFVTAHSLAVWFAAQPSGAEVVTRSSWRAEIARQNFAGLTSPIFNIPPRRQTFPDWLEGTWSANQTFAGFAFPTLPRETVMREADVPGFKTCSIVDFADVGKTPLQYQLRWERAGSTVLEDLPFNLRSSVSAHLSRKGAVTDVQYVPERDPNRLTLAVSGSKNAERVELFVNARDSESPRADLFFTSEYRRQVMVSSRIMQGYNSNYQHFKSFKLIDPNTAQMNVLTAAYVDPLSPLYFETFDKPVLVFSHNVQMSRLS